MQGHIGSATARDAAALGMDVIGYDPGTLANPYACRLTIDAGVALDV